MNLQQAGSLVVFSYSLVAELGDLTTFWACSVMHEDVLGERSGSGMVSLVSLIVPAGPRFQFSQSSNPKGDSAKWNIFGVMT